jgi:hypothetical protein
VPRTPPEPHTADVAKGSAGTLRILTVLVVLAFPAACGFPKSDPAVWTVSDQGLTPSSTTITLQVTRTGCGEPQSGTVLPHIDTGTSTITITLRISPHWSGNRTCENDGSYVPYRVHLNEPIGTRNLIDGQCAPLGSADTGLCPPNGVRLTWQHGQPVIPVS